MYPLTVDHLAILRDRHIDAGAAFGIDQLDGLRHGVGVLAAVFHGFKAKAGPVQMRVLGAFVRLISANLWVSFITGPRNETGPSLGDKPRPVFFCAGWAIPTRFP